MSRGSGRNNNEGAQGEEMQERQGAAPPAPAAAPAAANNNGIDWNAPLLARAAPPGTDPNEAVVAGIAGDRSCLDRVLHPGSEAAQNAACACCVLCLLSGAAGATPLLFNEFLKMSAATVGAISGASCTAAAGSGICSIFYQNQNNPRAEPAAGVVAQRPAPPQQQAADNPYGSANYTAPVPPPQRIEGYVEPDVNPQSANSPQQHRML